MSTWVIGLPICSWKIAYLAFELRMLLLEGRHQWHHRKEVIAPDVEHELRIRHLAMEIGEVVYFRNRTWEPAGRRILVFSVLPGRKDRIVLDRLRRVCGDRQKESGGQYGGAKGCLAHLSSLCRVVKAGLLQPRNRRNDSEGQDRAVNQIGW
jgi:hypothetical protein